MLIWLARHNAHVRTALDPGCEAGMLRETLSAHGIQTVGIDLSESMIQIADPKHPEHKEIPYYRSVMNTLILY